MTHLTVERAARGSQSQCQRGLLCLKGGERLQGRIQAMLLQQEGAPHSAECAADKELKGIPAVKASSD